MQTHAPALRIVRIDSKEVYDDLEETLDFFFRDSRSGTYRRSSERLGTVTLRVSASSSIRTSRPITRSEKRRTHSRARRPGASLEECHKPLPRRYRSWLSQKWERPVGTLSNGSPPKERRHGPWFVAGPGQWLLTVTQTMTSPLQERDNLLLSVSLF